MANFTSGSFSLAAWKRGFGLASTKYNPAAAATGANAAKVSPRFTPSTSQVRGVDSAAGAKERKLASNNAVIGGFSGWRLDTPQTPAKRESCSEALSYVQRLLRPTAESTAYATIPPASKVISV